MIRTGEVLNTPPVLTQRPELEGVMSESHPTRKDQKSASETHSGKRYHSLDVSCCHCGKQLKRYETKTGKYYCNTKCKADWQRSQKPVDRDWLYQKYIVEKLSAVDIAKIVNRNSKRVWEWLRDYGIDTRPRGYCVDQIAFWKNGKDNPFKGKHHTEEFKNKIRELRLLDGHVPYMKDGKVYMKGRTGALHHGYKGGITPDRQAFYSKQVWKDAVVIVWKRDSATCQRCGLEHKEEDNNKRKFHIHHVYSFEEYKLLRSNPDNLVLLCAKCHRWVHGKDNKDYVFLAKKEIVLPSWLTKR
jgi:hypothetical protein